MNDLPTALLLDMDGTLVDTEPYWIAEEQALVAAHGGTWTLDQAHALVGNPLLTSADVIRTTGPVDLTNEQIVEHLLTGVITRFTAHVPWRPGATDLLANARTHAIPCALVTMSWTAFADELLARTPPGTFTTVVTGDTVTHGKPHPEPYLTACTTLGIDPTTALAVEDSPTGVASAVAARCPTVAVPHVVPVAPDAGATIVDTLAGHDVASLWAMTRPGRATT